MERETKLVGWFALALGCIGIVVGISLFFGSQEPQAGLGCRAICGLTLAITELFGRSAGGLAGASLWLAAGSAFSWFGYRLLKRSAP